MGYLHLLQVSHLWKAGHHEEARSASTKTKQLAVTALVCGSINAVICFVIGLTSIITVLSVQGYFSQEIYIY